MPIHTPSSIPLRIPFAPNRGFNFAKPIRVTNRTTKLTDYQIEVDLNADNFAFEKARPNGADIRFQDANGKSLSYWIESWNAITEIATIWVKLDELEAYEDRIIWLIYGNYNGANESNGTNTFLLYDDFSTSLDWTTKWQSNNQGLYSTSGGNLVLLDGGLTYTDCLNSQNSFSGGYAFQARQRVVGSGSCETYLSSEGSVASITLKEQISIRRGDTLLAYVAGAASTGDSGVSGTWYRSKLLIPSSGTAGTYLYSDGGSLIVSKTGTPTYTTGYIGLHQRPSSTGYLDWIRVRRYTAIAPLVEVL